MRALKFLTGHMIYNLTYTFILPDDNHLCPPRPPAPTALLIKLLIQINNDFNLFLI